MQWYEPLRTYMFYRSIFKTESWLSRRGIILEQFDAMVMNIANSHRLSEARWLRSFPIAASP